MAAIPGNTLVEAMKSLVENSAEAQFNAEGKAMIDDYISERRPAILRFASVIVNQYQVQEGYVVPTTHEDLQFIRFVTSKMYEYTAPLRPNRFGRFEHQEWKDEVFRQIRKVIVDYIVGVEMKVIHTNSIEGILNEAPHFQTPATNDKISARNAKRTRRQRAVENGGDYA